MYYADVRRRRASPRCRLPSCRSPRSRTAAVLVGTGRAAYRKTVRRGAGPSNHLVNVVTFGPAPTTPLRRLLRAERAVPELRSAAVPAHGQPRRASVIAVNHHSQGKAIIGAATMLQLPTSSAGRIALLTFVRRCGGSMRRTSRVLVLTAILELHSCNPRWDSTWNGRSAAPRTRTAQSRPSPGDMRH